MTEQTKTTTTEAHKVTDLVRDHRIQRSLIPARVKRIRTRLNLDGIGVMTVSRRDDGAMVILDGQHRAAALVDAGLGDWQVTCHIYTGLSLAEEAGIFRYLNDTRRATAYDDFTKGVLEGDAECVAINSIIEGHRLQVTDTAVDGAIAAVDKARKLYRGTGQGGPYPHVLDQTLTAIVNAWGRGHAGLDGHVLHGIGMVIARYGEQVEIPVLTRKLSKRPGGPDRLLGDARGFKNLRGGTVAKNVALAVLDTYNRGRRTGQLPPL